MKVHELKLVMKMLPLKVLLIVLCIELQLVSGNNSVAYNTGLNLPSALIGIL